MSIRRELYVPVEETRTAALKVLLHNARGPYQGLPRTAGWGYPEPYTRDLMISALGTLASGNEELTVALRKTLEALAKNQTGRGHITSLAHDPNDVGASDTTPLFLLVLALYREAVGDPAFLEEAAAKALTWMEYQAPDDRVMVGQLPTSDWRDEQWVIGYGSYVNSLVYMYLRLFGHDERAATLSGLMRRFAIQENTTHRHIHEGLGLRRKPYYALWAYKVYADERFDLLGNSLAVISGLASPSRRRQIVAWVEHETQRLIEDGQLAVDLPPNLFPYIQPTDPDWRPRYERFNMPGDYHNGGIWPFICGFYVVAIVAAGFTQRAHRRLEDLTRLVRGAKDEKLEFGFNEWHRAQDGLAQGQDWQTWSAAMYLYAAACVEKGNTLFFDEVRRISDTERKRNGR
jgi:hypothetical protein